jgi:hypothetical protein
MHSARRLLIVNTLGISTSKPLPTMDVTQALKDAENSLRDFIFAALNATHGDSWLDHLGVSSDRIAKWKERRDTEAKRQEAGVVEERLLYYADFYDLFPVIKKNWQLFAPVFGELRTIEVWLKELERLRDPDAHRRELLPHQKHLVLGISGEIRNRIVRYRSKEETAEDYFPRIESVRDSLGHIWTAGSGLSDLISGKVTLRPGDVIDFVVTANDPLGQPLSYGMRLLARSGEIVWQNSGTWSLRIGEGDVSRTFFVDLMVKSCRDYHARSQSDDLVTATYQVLPRRTTNLLPTQSAL